MTTIPLSAGIYKITCTANSKVYVGSTTDIHKRWLWHRSDLRHNKHHNRHLQFAWNKYGEPSFVFEVLEKVCNPESLHEREQYWLDQYRAYDHEYGFNAGKVARAPWLGRSHSIETKQKLSDGAKARRSIEIARPFADIWHGTDEGREWHGQHAKAFWATRTPVLFQCDFCGADYESRAISATNRFCSNKCKTRARHATGVDNVSRQCAWCGAMFIINRYARAKCCSRSCGSFNRGKVKQ